MGTTPLGPYVKCTSFGLAVEDLRKVFSIITENFKEPTPRQARDLVKVNSSREGLEIHTNDEIERKMKVGNQII